MTSLHHVRCRHHLTSNDIQYTKVPFPKTLTSILIASHLHELAHMWIRVTFFFLSNLNIILWLNTQKNKQQKAGCWLKTKLLIREKQWQQILVSEHRTHLFMNIHLAPSATCSVKLAFLHWCIVPISWKHSLPGCQHTCCSISPMPAKWEESAAITTWTNSLFV